MDESVISWRVHQPYSHMISGECLLCHVVVTMDTKSEVKAALLTHVARCHPAAYEAWTGSEPTPERIAEQVYLIREGFQ